MRKKVPLPSERQARVLKKIASAQTTHPRETQEEWRRLKELASEAEPIPYNLNVSYQENQALAHPTFGLGFVRKVIDAAKIEVVFEHEVKILAMNRAKSE
jgi:hypothetical protein